MKYLKRIIILFLVTVLVLSDSTLSMLALADDTVFADDFSNANMEGWSDANAGSVQDGHYRSKGDNFNLVTKVGVQDKVSVSAKASVAVTKNENGFKVGTTAYVCAREAQDGSSGYEFGIGVTKTGETFVRLYRRDINNASKILYQTTEEIEGIGKIIQGQYYTLRLVVSEHTLYCLINDVMVCVIEDSSFVSGYTGIKTVGGTADFDDFEIEKVPDKKIEEMTVTEHSTKISRAGKLYFTLKIKYNSVYGSEILNQDSAGVSCSGLDGTTGKKTIHVSYGGKNTTFEVDVVNKSMDRVVYSNDFASGNLDDWNEGEYTNSTYGFTYDFSVRNGVACIDAPHVNKNFASSYVCNLTRPLSETKDYKNYSVEVKTAIVSDSNLSVTRYGGGALIFAQDSMSGQFYELRITSNGQIDVYKKGVSLYSTKFETALEQEFQYGKFYTLRADVYTGCARLYINDKLIVTLADIGDPSTSAYIGMRATYGSIKFDDFKVISLEEKGEYAVKSIYVIKGTTGKTLGSTVQYKFNMKENVIIANYIDGSQRAIRLTEDMISPYDKESSQLQIITVTYGGKSYSFKYQYKPYLFYDNFENGIDEQWKFTTTKLTNYSVASGKLQLTYDSSQGDERGTITGMIKSGTEWTDYSASADVFLETKANKNLIGRYHGICVRWTGNSRYEFRINVNAAGTFTANLLKTIDKETTTIKTYTATQLKYLLNEKQTLGTGQTYNIRLDAIGTTLYMYFNNKLLDTYTDESDDALLTGTAGIRVLNSNCMYDNFIVQEKQLAKITSLTLSKADKGKYHIWRGNGIDIWNNYLVIKYSDGVVEQIPLTEKHVGPFACDEVGSHTVMLSYDGAEFPITIIVDERPEYIKEFITQLKAFSKKVKENNQTEFEELKKYYDSLTPYEVSQLSKKQMKKYNKLLTSYELLIAPELKKEKLVINADFSGGDTETWGDSREGNLGIWNETNGVYYEAQSAYGRSGNGWRCPDIYGEFTGMSADCMLLTSDMHIGFGINVGVDGYYHVRVTTNVYNSEEEQLYQLQLLRRSASGHQKLEVLDTEVYDHKLTENQWFNLKMTLIDNTIRVYIDGENLITYEETGRLFDTGEAGLRISSGDGLYDNVRIYGTLLEKTSSADDIEPTYYEDDFEDETVGQNPSHWVEAREADVVTDNWKVVQSENGKAYATKKVKNTVTYLHVFDNNPQIKTDIKVSKLSANSKFGFLTRMAPTESYVKVLYDNAKKQWCVVYTQSKAEGNTVVCQEGTFDMKEGKWYSAELIEKGINVLLKIDGEEILSFKNIMHDGYGRIGFCAENTEMSIDNFKVELSTGDIPQDGIVDFTMNHEKYAGFMEIESFDNGKNLLGVATNYLMTSNDSGMTWKDVTKDETYSQIYHSNYTSLLKMSNGKYLQICNYDDWNVQISEDLIHWETISMVVPLEEQYNAYGSRYAIIHVNTTTEIELENGTKRIFCPVAMRKFDDANSAIGHYTVIYYSDDFGYTWQKSETTTKELLPGYTDDNNETWAEAKVTKCTDGTLRIYYTRNKLGCMQYTESKDGGLTWSGLYQVPEIQQALSSSAIFEDPYNPGTYYMYCLMGTPRYAGSLHPRNHSCLLRSTDGKNWEFLMNVEWMNDYTSQLNGVELYQLLDPSLYITEDYVHITFGRSEYEYSETDAFTHQGQRVRYVRVEKDKLAARAWDASTIADMRYPKTVEIEEMPQTKFGMSDLFACQGTVKLTDFYGNVTYEEILDGCICYSEPNMFKLGKTTVHLRYKNGTDLSYDIEIVPNYNITWELYGEGSVEPEAKRIMEGGEQTFTLVSGEGWKAGKVLVNGKKIKMQKAQFNVSDVQEDLTISVYFAKKTVFDYVIFWVILAAILLASVWFVLYKTGKIKLIHNSKEEQK